MNLLEENFAGFPLELVLTKIKNNKKPKTKVIYGEKMKEFALTLYFYSPKAYRFLKKHDFGLPNPSTIRRWVSKFNCSPGFLNEVFSYLKNNVQNKDDFKHFNLVFDAMSIRKQIVYDHNKVKNYGYVDVGGFQLENQEEVATEALVFQVVSLKNAFKCAIGYFFVNKINAQFLSQLIKVAIIKLFEVGCNIHSVTFDGTSTNLKALKLLGCKFPEKPFFSLPGLNYEICAMVDACHVLKLCRNALADKRVIASKDGLIEFKYFERLNELQKSEGCKLANKLGDRHIFYRNKKMNVKLAAQTLSSGVADALKFLNESKVPRFDGCEPTIKFVKIIDHLFDYFNSRDPHGKYFKAPIRESNKQFYENELKNYTDYLCSLKIDDISLLSHPRKTFLLGLLVYINSMRKLTERLLIQENFKYILTYKFSQDHLELLFSCIRSAGGHNNNPNTLLYVTITLRTIRTITLVLYSTNVL